MKDNLLKATREYVQLIEEIEKTTEPLKLQKLEELRVQNHWKFIDLLRKQGIPFKDKEHETHIAMKITTGEI